MSEIERKWLLETLPNYDSPDIWTEGSESISQDYIMTNPEVRLRQKGLLYYLTVKSDEGLVREELEVEIEPDDFGRLWPLTEGRYIEKQRFDLVVGTPIGRCYHELDIYRGRHDGLIVVEKEFDSVEAAEVFQLSPLIGPATEVTLDERYKKRWLAEHATT